MLRSSRSTVIAVALAFTATLSVAADEDRTRTEWRFDREDLAGWKTHGQIAEPRVQDGSLAGRPSGSDPILLGPVFEVAANAAQYVEVSLRSAAEGTAELYWTETLEGKFGGFSAEKLRTFQVRGDGEFHVYRVWPFWHPAKKIVRLRFDPPNGGPFAIRWIRIAEQTPSSSPGAAWDARQFKDLWRDSRDASACDAPIWLSPMLSLKAAERAFVCVRMAATVPGSGRIYSVTRDEPGWEYASFPLRADGQLHSYNIDTSQLKNWRGEVLRLGVQVPAGPGTRIESVEASREPCGPAEVEVAYFGPSDGINRAGRPAGVSCTLRNRGGQVTGPFSVRLEVPPGAEVVGGSQRTIDRLSIYLPKTAQWQIRAGRAGTVPLTLHLGGEGVPAAAAKATIELTPAPPTAPSDHVPEPRPVKSRYEIGAFYFPGWSTAEQWQPIRDFPNRKPILGWYDESNPQCADWQIKWAVEHGVSFFMVDWYWSAGSRQLEHWLHNAYAKARHRKYLKWAIMWANHNPPKTHSEEDWRKVTRYWIDHYFSMPEYYRIDGRPAVFLWSPQNVRQDLGSSQQAAKLYAISQEMARAAGHKGVYFLAMSSHESKETAEQLRREGFEGLTMYHGFQLAHQRAGSDRFPFASLLETCPGLWAQVDQRAAGLLHLPIVDTGWDARPWHGERTLVAHGRTPELFGQLCRLARRHADETGKRIVAIGPWNEWGEGSYIEPYAEHGFRDLDQLRTAFCEPGDWPPNLIPSDVGLGPYDLPAAQARSAWEFNTPGALEGWSHNGAVEDLKIQEGALTGRSSGPDPVLVVSGLTVEAAQLRTLRMRIKSDRFQHVQVFWSTSLSPMRGEASLGVDMAGDGQFHDYTIDLGKSPHWRGVVSALRIDPATEPGPQFAIDYVRLE